MAARVTEASNLTIIFYPVIHFPLQVFVQNLGPSKDIHNLIDFLLTFDTSYTNLIRLFSYAII